MSFEAEMPGQKMNSYLLKIIYYRYFFAINNISDEDHVLEIGSGSGIGLGILDDNAGSVIGSDYMFGNVKHAKNHYINRIPLVALDGNNLPLKKYSLDKIVAMEVLQYLDISEFIKEVRRVLKPGGALLFNIPNKNRPHFKGSELSNKYYNAGELYEIFGEVAKKIDLYGVFRTDSSNSQLISGGFRTSFFKLVVACINSIKFIFPVEIIKSFFKKKMNYSTDIIPLEINSIHFEKLRPECEPIKNVTRDYMFIYGKVTF